MSFSDELQMVKETEARKPPVSKIPHPHFLWGEWPRAEFHPNRHVTSRVSCKAVAH